MECERCRGPALEGHTPLGMVVFKDTSRYTLRHTFKSKHLKVYLEVHFKDISGTLQGHVRVKLLKIHLRWTQGHLRYNADRKLGPVARHDIVFHYPPGQGALRLKRELQDLGLAQPVTKTPPNLPKTVGLILMTRCIRCGPLLNLGRLSPLTVITILCTTQNCCPADAV